MGAVHNELNAITDQIDIIVAEIATDLFQELIKATPVQTSYLKGGWELSESSNNEWIITNPVEYAEIRLRPMIEGANGKLIQGSRQFPAGIMQIIDKYDRILQKRFKAIKWVQKHYS